MHWSEETCAAPEKQHKERIRASAHSWQLHIASAAMGSRAQQLLVTVMMAANIRMLCAASCNAEPNDSLKAAPLIPDQRRSMSSKNHKVSFALLRCRAEHGLPNLQDAVSILCRLRVKLGQLQLEGRNDPGSSWTTHSSPIKGADAHSAPTRQLELWPALQVICGHTNNNQAKPYCDGPAAEGKGSLVVPVHLSVSRKAILWTAWSNHLADKIACSQACSKFCPVHEA